ncbi:MAG TPA: phosphatidylglycerophosphatase A [Rhizomicrobium sp.]|nr:phosphatidylglycerophosphatase A [Rhizomicrobium sp.]
MNDTSNTRAANAIATVFGIGFVRPAPGTAASVVALPVAWLIAAFLGRWWLVLAAIAVLAVGAWACEIYARSKGDPDPSECVIDEVAGQWIICAFAPVSILAYVVAFILFRLFDILKPWPINIVEKEVPGGLGIMADDVVAALMGAIILIVLTQLGLL